MSNQPRFSTFPIPYVGGRARPRYPSADPFSSPLMSPVNVSEADNEAILGAPSRRRRFRLSDKEKADGPRLTIGEGDLAGIRRRYSIPESVKLRCAREFERAPDVLFCFLSFSAYTINMAYADCYPSAGRTSGYTVWDIQMNELPHGVRGGFPHDDLWNRRYMFMKVNGATGYPMFWRSIGEASVKLAMEISKRFRWIPFLVNQATLSHSRVWGFLGFRYRQYMASTIGSNRGGGDIILHVRREQCIPPHEEILFLRAELRNMASHQAWVTQRTRAFARWEHMREFQEKNVNHRDLDGEYRRSLSSGGGIWTGCFPSMMPSPNGFGP
ncbi:hypothetical protein Bca101_020070 [Brassica carinata]